MVRYRLQLMLLMKMHSPKHKQNGNYKTNVLSWLLSTLSEEAMPETLGCKTSHAAWTALEMAYSLHSKSREIQLKDELQLLRRGSQSVQEYSRKFKTLCDQLAAIDCPVANVDKVHGYLRGLGPQFSTFSLTQLNITPLPDFKDVVPKAESFSLFQKSLEDAPAAPVAFALNQQSAAANSSRSINSNRRGGRSQSGFSNTAQNRSEQQGRRNNNNRRPLRCQICRQEGHYDTYYPDRFNRTPSSSPTAQLAQAFNAVSLPNNDSPDWYMDSGGSSHISSTTSNLDSVSTYSEQENRIDRGKGKA